jgi:DNA-binding transcriptional MerR regulator
MASSASEIPDKGLYKASEICEIAGLQPFVLKSWEKEFPDLGVTKKEGSARVYRRADLDRVLEIRRLVFGEGLTLAGVRRRLEEQKLSSGGQQEDTLLSPELRQSILGVRQGLAGILQMLNGPPGGNGRTEFIVEAAPPAEAPARAARARSRPAKSKQPA